MTNCACAFSGLTLHKAELINKLGLDGKGIKVCAFCGGQRNDTRKET